MQGQGNRMGPEQEAKGWWGQKSPSVNCQNAMKFPRPQEQGRARSETRRSDKAVVKTESEVRVLAGFGNNIGHGMSATMGCANVYVYNI